MKKYKKLNLDHIFIHAIFQSIAGIVYGFGIYMYIKRGFDQATAGICLSCMNILSLVLAPFVSNFLDRSKKVTVFDMLLIESILITILFLINTFIASKSIYLALVMIVGCGLYASLEPLVNSLSSKFVSNGIPIEFSTARAVGSISYGACCALFGILSDKFDYKIVLIGGFVFSLLFTIVIFLTKKDYNFLNIVEQEKNKDDLISFNEFFVNHKNYMFLCLFLTLIMIGYTGIDNFMLLVCENVGGTSADMGISLGVKAFFEGLGMILLTKLLKKFKLTNLLIVGAFGFALKIVMTWLAKNIYAIYLSQVIQMIGFAFIFPGMVKLVGEKMNSYEAIRGQAFFTMTISFGSMISSSLAGIISSAYGTSMMELACLIISFIGALGFTYFVKKQ